MEEVVVYDQGFNGNEWYVIAIIVTAFLLIWVLPNIFTFTQTLYTLLIGIVFGLMFDHTIAIPPFDLYDIGDNSSYEVWDFLSYGMYAPFGYLYIYFYKRLGVHGFYTIPYILAWTVLSIGIEWLGVLVGVFHYKHGYRLYFSIPIYLFLQSVHLLIYSVLFPESPTIKKTVKKPI
ncbi:hypothetical protein HQN90_24140 [Paenibacillus alba]|uniref:hypothetical protein n=1 Tax=Paenibacillus alba TaxID=1197127 RepID=UPI001564A7DC|nr:hypothetical protein [Paenibacillus alba]NQX69227.1 hypothetical protein [Paenibacillus alba]